jgi:enoyl-CoA hydratase/carnithine racemase
VNIISAAESRKIGLVNKVVPADELEKAAEDMAGRILRNNQEAIRKIKSMISRGSKLNFGEALQMEKTEFTLLRRQPRPGDLNVRIN